MADKIVEIFKSGVHNLLEPEKIPADAAKDSLNFITKDGKVVLVHGRIELGDDGAVGSVRGLHPGYKTNGSTVLYRKVGTTIQYYDGSAWQNTITGLTESAEYVFANYSSLAGAFTLVLGPDGYWKFVNANPDSPIDIYDSSKNFKGKMMIDKGRTLLWDRLEDKTGLYGSKIDPQDSTVYTTVSGEAIGALGSQNYTGTLAFKSGGSTRNCFGVVFSESGGETFTDNYDGTLTGDAGGTGTINYATGAYDITFNAVTSGAVTADYQWEDSTDGGLADFGYSATRLAGEGFVFPQDEGGDAILNVLIGQDGAYYSLKEKSAYYLSIDADDLGATNEVYRKNMGLPNFRAAASIGRGIVFMNTANPTKPQMTILQKNKVSDSVEPFILFPQFKFENYNYDDAAFATYDRWVVIFCREIGDDTNNRILLGDIQNKTVDIVNYSGRMGIQDGNKFYVGDSFTQTVYTTFDGFDNLGSTVGGYWSSKDDLLGTTRLKKVRRLRFKGRIDPDQYVEVYKIIEGTSEELVGTIRGDGSYVDYNDVQVVGGQMVGEGQVGGDDVSQAYGYFVEMKLKGGKFRNIGIKLVPKGIGYFDMNYREFHDILTFEQRIPKAYRQKQNVSLDGTQTDQ